MNEVWELGLSRADLVELGATVGSDVPYFFQGGTALASGRGEIVVPLGEPPTMWFVLGVSDPALRTTDVYRRWDEMSRGAEVPVEPMVRAVEEGASAERIAALLHNDLERAAFELRPDLPGKKDALLRAGALGAGVAGSGPTLFAIASDEAHAGSIAAVTADEFDRVLVAISVPKCIERLD